MNMTHGCVDLHEHSIVSCPDYIRKMRSGNETKHSVTPASTRPQARPDASLFLPLSPLVVPPLQLLYKLMYYKQSTLYYFIVYADTEVPWSSDYIV